MNKLLFSIFLLFVSLLGSAQQEIRGKVTAEDGSPIPGATVLIQGTMEGTTTNVEGAFSIKGSEGDVLKISFIGMKTISVSVDDRDFYAITLENETFDVDEVVVVGYGTQKKRDVTGAVSVVNSETINQLKPVKVEQALQGTTAGINVTSQSGAPGAGLDIRIRGISTNGDASPVAIIDGYQGDLNTLNPDDIESITVLKDAQAAIYGTVGANGIILVTTKSGKKNTPTKVSINSSYGIQEATRKLPMLNATEYAVLLNESYAVSGRVPPYSDISNLGRGTNWQNELFSTAPIATTNINLTGGYDKVTYSLSASDLSQQGIIGGDKSDYGRNTARMSMGADLFEGVKLNSSITYTYISRKAFNDFGLGSVLFNALNMPPTIPVYNSVNEYSLAPTTLGIEIINPLAQLENTYNDYGLSKFNGNFGLDFDLAKNLTATARIGFNTTNTKSKSFSKIVDYGGKVFDVSRSSVYQDRNNYNDYTFDAFINYDNTFNENHHLTLTLGTTVYKTWGSHLDGTGYDIPNNSWDFADISLVKGISETKSTGSWNYDQRRLSYFTRLQYDYQGKYLLSAMLRRDASTKFGPDNKVAYFPSVTMGWVMSEEDFMNSTQDWLDFLKMRLSYGLLGSDKIGDYQYISQLSGEATYVFDNALVNGTAVGANPNPSVKWEQSEQFDAGVDVKLFGNRLDISTDYFIKTTRNLLIGNIPVSGILGVSAPGAAGPTVNAGTVRNSGFEFAIAHRNHIGDFNYNVAFNLTTLNNEVLEVNNGSGFVEGGSFGVGQPLPARMEVGFPIGYFYGYKTDGIFQNQAEVDAYYSQVALGAEAVPGDIRFVDVNPDGVINSDDRTYIGDPIPDVTMGLNLTLEFKGFDFVTYIYSSIGNEMVRNYERVQANVNRLGYYVDRWRGEGTSNAIPRVTTAATANNVFSDFYVEDASFARIQNLQLGYTLPLALTGKIGIEKLRFFSSVSNLYTFTKYMGYDPAASTGQPVGSGFDNGFYPAARTYTFGINLEF